jgi:ABC-type enterochelin transport system substrate-binding protein
MRHLWIIGVLTVALLGAGCAFGNTTATTSTTAKSAKTPKTSTTVHTATKGTVDKVAGPNDKVACASLATLKSDKAKGVKPTATELKQVISQLKKADDPRLHTEAGYLGRDLLEGKTKNFDHAESVVTGICSKLGLS